MGCFYLTSLSLRVSEINLSIVAPSFLCLCLTFLNKSGYAFVRKHFRLDLVWSKFSHCRTKPFHFNSMSCLLSNSCPVWSFLLIALHCIMSTHASGVVFLKFVHLHRCISFRYARRIMRGRKARDDGIEPQDGEWWTHPEDGRTVWSACWDWRWCQASARLQSNWLTLCQTRQAPEHNP